MGVHTIRELYHIDDYLPGLARTWHPGHGAAARTGPFLRTALTRRG